MNDKYVSKEEVKPYRHLFHQWMEGIRDFIKENGISFTYMLVGSAKRNLVIRHHNKGFDCDYQIMITRNKKNLCACKIKHLFMDELNKFVTKDGYTTCKNSTSSITIKKIGENGISMSFDAVILIKENNLLKILRYNKDSLTEDKYKYGFETLPDMKEFSNNLMKIKGQQLWNKLRDLYYQKKMIELTENKTGKKSFQILHEAVNEILFQNEHQNIK